MATFSTLLDSLSPDSDVKGKQFEHIRKWFPMNDPACLLQLRKVWLWDALDSFPGWLWDTESGFENGLRHLRQFAAEFGRSGPIALFESCQ